MHVHAHTHARTHTQVNKHTCTQTNVHTYTNKRAHILTNRDTDTHRHIHTHAHIHTHTCRDTDTDTDTQTHTHTHTYIYTSIGTASKHVIYQCTLTINTCRRISSQCSFMNSPWVDTSEYWLRLNSFWHLRQLPVWCKRTLLYMWHYTICTFSHTTESGC